VQRIAKKGVVMHHDNAEPYTSAVAVENHLKTEI
jgi:hypothetical protein